MATVSSAVSDLLETPLGADQDGELRRLGPELALEDRPLGMVGDEVLEGLSRVLRLLQRGRPGLGQHQAAARRLEQGRTQRLLQFAHLGRHGLHGQPELLRRAGQAALLGHGPEVVQVAIAEAQAHDLPQVL